MPPPALTVGTALPDPPFELMQDGKAGGVRHRLTQLIAARLNAAVLLRLHRLGGTVGQRREMVNALKQGLKNVLQNYGHRYGVREYGTAHPFYFRAG
jgi:hypothetical protein